MTLTELSFRQETLLAGFSVLFTINIAVSNVSLYVEPPAPPAPSSSTGCQTTLT